MSEVKWETNYVDVRRKRIVVEVESADSPGFWTRLDGEYSSVERAKEDIGKFVFSDPNSPHAGEIFLKHRGWTKISRFRLIRVEELVAEEGEVVE